MDKSVTQLIADLKGGDEEAARQLWERFFQRLCVFARNKVRGATMREKDEEDLALSALNAVFAGAKDGRFHRLDSRDDLWMLLTCIASRKAISHLRRTNRQLLRGESVFGAEDEAVALHEFVSSESGESFLDALSLTCRERLESLDDMSRKVALYKLEGYSNEEIAVKIARSIRSVERYLFLLRAKWSTE